MDDLRLWVVDTSTLIQITQAGLSRERQSSIFSTLTTLVEADLLVFPPQVLAELERGENRPGDAALTWARHCREKGERDANLETVRAVLARAPLLIDPHATHDQADPYVIALAIDTQTLGGVSILSEDRRDRHAGDGALEKLSVATAAGLWDVPVVPIAGFRLRFRDLG